MNPVVCKLVILTVRGVLLCGADGDFVDPNALMPGYQHVYDAELDKQYCVPTDDLRRARYVDFKLVGPKLRADSVACP
jgi:hypothetical protein